VSYPNLHLNSTCYSDKPSVAGEPWSMAGYLILCDWSVLQRLADGPLH